MASVILMTGDATAKVIGEATSLLFTCTYPLFTAL